MFHLQNVALHYLEKHNAYPNDEGVFIDFQAYVAAVESVSLH